MNKLFIAHRKTEIKINYKLKPLGKKLFAAKGYNKRNFYLSENIECTDFGRVRMSIWQISL